MSAVKSFNAARSIVCVETIVMGYLLILIEVSMPHAALCVSRRRKGRSRKPEGFVSMPHAALCVSRRCVPQPLSRAG